jgi:hypothetical protein
MGTYPAPLKRFFYNFEFDDFWGCVGKVYVV